MPLMLDDDYPETLGLIAHAAYAWLRDNLALDEHQAGEAAFTIAEAVRTQLGGGHMYLPKGIRYVLSNRDREIWARFTGDNYDMLAREFHLTEMRIRQIVERCRKEDSARRQTDLFPSS